MEKAYVTVGFRKLKGYIIKEVDGKYLIELDDRSNVIVDKNQIEKRKDNG